MTYPIMKNRTFCTVIAIALAAASAPGAFASGGCTKSSLNGPYIVQVNGFANISTSGQLSGKFIPNVIVGLLTFDGAGNFTAAYTESANGHLFKNQNNSGTYVVKSDCTGSLKSPDGGYHWQFVLLSDGTEAYAIETDAGTTNTATLKKQ